MSNITDHDAWKSAVHELLITNFSLTEENANDPFKALFDLIAIEVEQARDPRVSRWAAVRENLREAATHCVEVLEREAEDYEIAEAIRTLRQALHAITRDEVLGEESLRWEEEQQENYAYIAAYEGG